MADALPPHLGDSTYERDESHDEDEDEDEDGDDNKNEQQEIYPMVATVYWQSPSWVRLFLQGRPSNHRAPLHISSRCLWYT